jgi:hypothetical protein
LVVEGERKLAGLIGGSSSLMRRRRIWILSLGNGSDPPNRFSQPMPRSEDAASREKSIRNLLLIWDPFKPKKA